MGSLIKSIALTCSNASQGFEATFCENERPHGPTNITPLQGFVSRTNKDTADRFHSRPHQSDPSILKSQPTTVVWEDSASPRNIDLNSVMNMYFEGIFRHAQGVATEIFGLHSFMLCGKSGTDTGHGVLQLRSTVTTVGCCIPKYYR
jgi:hypothetical protein